MNIPVKYLLKEGEDAAEGTTIKKCCYCNSEFAIPDEELSEMSDFCEVCAPEVEKQMEESAGNEEAAEAISNALGN